jgi:stage II sporulation protein AA (anti-sigma F factor antagonist)
MDIAGVKCIMSDNSLLITIEGEIDHHTAKFIRDEIDKAIYYYRPQKAVMDLSEITFMDSSGLGLILGRYTQMIQLGGSFKLKDPTPEITKILILAGVDRLIPTEISSNLQ